MLYNKSCYGLPEIEPNTVHALITDPPYGIAYQNKAWDKPENKSCPDPQIWQDCCKVMKAGAFGAVFSFPRVMHRLMVDLEDRGFIIKDVLMWVYLNGMPKSKNIGLEIDKLENVASEVVGQYNYVQGYVQNPNGSETYTNKTKKNKLKPVSELGKFYDGAGLGIKPCYEPIIIIQKPIEKGLTIAENIVKYGTGALNLEATRLPYEEGEAKVGHNPHPKGRVPANILRTDKLHDGNDKYFYYGDKEDISEMTTKELIYAKVRQHKDDFNTHPTLKPVALMKHLVQLFSFENQIVLDPFMGSGSTGVACQSLHREFLGYEKEQEYFEIAKRRIG
jgi:site-specific DNA-methyltransferase (adenine-specific)